MMGENMNTFSDDDRCELNPDKLCDNCFRCLEPETGLDYARIEIAAVYTGEDYLIGDMAEELLEETAYAPVPRRVRAHTLCGVKAKKRSI